jgi:hypothetical protein
MVTCHYTPSSVLVEQPPSDPDRGGEGMAAGG